MTDHEDGPPPRGPRRYGPSATGAPRQDGVPPYEPPRAWSAADRTPSGRPVPSDPRPYPPLVDARSYIPGPAPTRPGSRPSSADPGAARPRGSLRGDPPPTAYRRPAPATPPVRTPSRHRWAGRLRLGRLVAGVLSAITLLA
ncbi:MAG: hypothetical protein ABJA16_13415, partial [Nakamurella sp.]